MFKKSMLAGIVVFGLSHAAFASDSVDLKIGGTMSSASCNISLDKKSMDWGSEWTSSDMFAKPATATITCPSAIMAGFKVTDDRESSADQSLYIGAAGSVGCNYCAAQPESRRFGLGFAGGKRIGSYTIAVDPRAHKDGATTNSIQRSSDQGQWTSVTSGFVNKVDNQVFSLGATDSGPATFQTATFDLIVTPNLEPDISTSSEQVTMDGMATFSLVYL